MLHCLAGVLYLATTDKGLSNMLIDLHHAGPEVDCIQLLQTLVGTALMGGAACERPRTCLPSHFTNVTPCCLEVGLLADWLLRLLLPAQRRTTLRRTCAFSRPPR